MLRPLAVSAVTRHLSEQVYAHASQGRCVLTLGGDHSIAIGTIAGTARAIRERLSKDLAVIWVDAHADINTPETSESGNIHGMPVAWLTGLAKEEREDVFGWLGQRERIELGKLVYIGLRDVDRGEKKILKDHNIRAFSMHDIDKYVVLAVGLFESRHCIYSLLPSFAQAPLSSFLSLLVTNFCPFTSRHGIGKVMDLALAHIGPDTPIHLSFDVDALDPQWAPSTGTPVRGGLTLREGDYIAECVHETGSLVAMDLVSVALL